MEKRTLTPFLALDRNRVRAFATSTTNAMETKTTSVEHTALWSRALRDPQLQNLPFKVETNEHGQIILSPRKPQHSISQYRIARLLEEHIPRQGQPAVEFAVDTPDGVKVPDVVWLSAARRSEIGADIEASPVMPELCVEVRSSRSNTGAEIDQKRDLFLTCGAEEFWTLDPNGHVCFYGRNGKISSSRLAPSFPAEIET